MNRQLQFLKKIAVLFPVALLLCFTGIKAQTLNQGDLAVIGWNALTDQVHLVTLVDIPTGTVIKITDKGWDQNTNAFTASFTGDGIVTWTLSNAVPAGTVLELFLGGADDGTSLTNLTTSASLTSDITASTYTINDAMILTGDQIFIYQGVDSNPFFIFGMNNSAGPVDATNWNTSIAASLRDSNLPNGSGGSQNALTNGINAIGLPGEAAQQDNVQYTGPTATADRNTWLARITNIANWTGSDEDDVTNPITSAPTPIVNIAPPNNAPTDITLSNASVNQSAGANAVVGTLSSTDADEDDTHTYALVEGVGDDHNDLFNIAGSMLRANDASAMQVGGAPYTVHIRTTDNVGGSYERAFVIVVVDDVAPTVSSVAVPANATYVAGQNLDFTINVSENITVTGTPQLPLTIGTASVNATYNAGGSTATALLFRYTIQPGDMDTDGIELDNGITLNGGTIADGADNNMNLAISSADASGVLVDGIAPSVTSVDVPMADTYGIGETLNFTVNFDEIVTVNTGGGTPRFPLTIDGTTRYASYQSGSGTNTLVFQYTVEEDDPESSITVGNVIDLNGSAITDLPGNAAVTDLNGIGSTTNVRVDGIRPTATIDIADTELVAGETTTVTITFSEAVSGFTASDLDAANGNLGMVESDDGGITWTVTFTPASGVADATNVITLVSTGVTDQAGNAGTGTTDSENYSIDTQRPEMTITVGNVNLHSCATAAVTFTFTKAVSGFDNSDLTVPYGTLTEVNSTDGGITWAATFTPDLNVQETGLVITLDNTGVTDDSGNTGLGTTVSNTFDINSMGLVLISGGQSAVSCFGGSNGTATVVASGGVGPYTYSWSPSGGTAATATGLIVGTYTVTVTDVNNCQATLDFTITEPPALVITPSQTNITCFGEADGTATVQVTGGAPPYSYSWTSSVSAQATATGLSAGSYTVTVTDNHGCEISQNFIINEPDEIVTSIGSITPVSTYGGNDGSATVSATGGTGSLTYSWSTTPVQTGPAATGLVAGTYTVTVTDENDCSNVLDVTITEPQPPTFSNLDGDVISFTESGPAVLIDAGGDATVSDPDSPDFNGGSLTVSIVSNGAAGEDRLTIRDEGTAAGQIGVSGGDVTYGGTTIGTLTGGTGGIDLIVTFNSAATPAVAQALIRNLTYSNSNSVNPSPDPRTIRITLADGDGATSAFQEVTVNITLVNDAPIVTTSGGTVTFTEPEDGNPVPLIIDPGLTVTDPDNTTLVSATVSITSNFESGEDLLAFVNDGSMGNISGIYDAGTGMFTLTSAGAAATLAEWQTALRAITYSNSSQKPNTAIRTISFVANDGTANSSPATKDVNIVAVNTAPVAVNDEIMVTEDVPATGNALTNDSDAEGNALTASLVTAPVNGTVVLNADGSLTYTPNSNYNGRDSLTYQVCDNGTPSLCDTALVYFNVGAINSAPSITAPATIAADEDVQTPLTGISFADVDAGSADVTATFSVADGTLSAVSGSGVTVSGSETGTLALVGAIADLNTFIAANNLAFTTALNATTDVTLTIDIDDGGNTGIDPGNSGTDDSEAATTTVTITVTAQNDAPVNTVPAGQTIDQDEPLVFSAASGNTVSVADVDAGGGTIQVTLTASNGLLTLGGTTGLTFISGSGTDDATVTFVGTIIDINAALEGLTMMPTIGYSGAASLQIVTNDLGLTGAGGDQMDTDVVDITVNEINPEVTSVNTTSPDGVYKMTDIINLTVTFDQVVTVDETGGLPTLLLETGSADREAGYKSGSGSNTLEFTYTVQAGDETTDLDYQSTAALTLNGATIQSAAGNDAVLTLPAVGGASSIAGQHAIIVDGVAPVVTVVDMLADGTYRSGDVLSFTVHYSEDIPVVGGMLTLPVTIGTTTVQAPLTDTTRNRLIFSYTVQNGELDTDGIEIGPGILLNGGALLDGAGNDASLALVGAGNTSGVLVDAVAPVVTSVSVPADGYYREADVLLFTVHMSEDVAVNDAVGTPYLDVMIGTATVQATYTGGSGTAMLAFSYTVQAENEDLDGIALGEDIILNDGTMKDAVGNDAALTLNDVAPTDNIFVYSKRPSVALSTEAASPVNAPFNVTATFSEAVTGFTLSDITVTNGTLSDLQTSDNSSYVFVVTPIMGGSVQLSVAADVAVNIANNGNDVSNTLRFQFNDIITGVTLEDSTFIYDGTAKSLVIIGDLPDGTSVTYENNSRTDAGTQVVTATVSGDNYEDLVLTADLTITATIITGITLEDGSFVYDGMAKSLAIAGDLPDGTSVSYANNSRTDAGTQEVTATISGDNYEDLVLTADLTITATVITGITLEDGSFVYDGTAKSLAIAGDLPDGTSVSYTNNSRTDAGTQEVTATVSGDNYEDLMLTAGLTVTAATRSIEFPAIPAKTYGDADFNAGATASTDEEVSYTSSDATVAEIRNGQIHITGAGTATITASVPENSNYSNRPEATQVLTVRKATQTITFDAPLEVYRDAGSIELVATASSGLPLVLTLDDPEVAKLEGLTLDILRLGTVRITAVQQGDANYEPAEPVTVAIRVIDPASDMPIRIHKAVSPNGDGINEYLIIEAIKDYPENRVTVFNRNGTIVYEVSGYNNGTKAFRGIGTGQLRVAAGTYFYVAEIKVDGKWKYEKGWFVLRY
ncbi:hypothetical protein GCM10007415_09220 [Parapedobacter pyrenivorans]|uniref:Gliding motility-associated C-terminal domain-containing protein n=1 Tax=Parapedobacter pyrenivorans TaxID=1305674 RepID=A0A917HHZ4_9SPHI|nr:Ig-like domain-containing protein [Parapedobacter pyrenivorans]GGG79225.1 hypothetical protein GCM10007415_09220 [Parapedobacter pyrenivorans]